MVFIKSIFPLIAAAVIALLVVFLSGTSTITHPPSVASPSAASDTSPATTAATSTKIKSTPEDPALVSARNLTAAGANLLKSAVNILCTPKNGSNLRGASGSGVIIDSRGLILTAAHIGQYFLLADGSKHPSVSCVIRTGGPAANAYIASLVYLSPSWLKTNPDTLIETAPKGTGENDFAVLAITGSATKTPLPSVFSFVPLGSDVPKVGEKVAIGAYAAQYLTSDTVRSDLYPTIVFDAVSNRYTFDTSTIDVISIKGTAAAQEGSSGGGLVDEHNQIVGLITTSSVIGDISEHTLHAITPRHIRASFIADGNADFDSYFASNDSTTLITSFSSEANNLRQILASAIGR